MVKPGKKKKHCKRQSPGSKKKCNRLVWNTNFKKSKHKKRKWKAICFDRKTGNDEAQD